jgi:hypothetical protein
MMVNRLLHQYELVSRKNGVRYTDIFFAPERVRELIRVADSRQKAYAAKSGAGQRGKKGEAANQRVVGY